MSNRSFFKKKRGKKKETDGLDGWKLNLACCPPLNALQAIEEEHKAIQVQEERRGSSKVRSWTKKMRGRVWMAEKFPLATSDLVPLLQILRCVNK